MNTLFKTVTSLHGPALRAANDAGTNLQKADRIFVNDLVFEANIGVYEDEKKHSQKLTASVEVLVSTSAQDYQGDDIKDVMSYEDIVDAVKQVKEEGHIHLLEHFAEQVAALCLENPKALQVTIQLTKENIFGCGEQAGVSITRTKSIR